MTAFAGPVLERTGPGLRWTLAVASVGLTDLVVHVGHQLLADAAVAAPLDGAAAPQALAR